MRTLATRECGPPAIRRPAPPGRSAGSIPLPQGNAYSVSTSATDGWAVGPLGTIARYNGTSWSLVKSGITSTLRSVWAASPTDAWAVRDGGTILHYDGQAWQPSKRHHADAQLGLGRRHQRLGGGTVGDRPSVLFDDQQVLGHLPAGVFDDPVRGLGAEPERRVCRGRRRHHRQVRRHERAVSSSGTTANLYGVGGDATQVYAVVTAAA